MNAKEFLEQPIALNEKINIDFLHLQNLKKMRKRFEILEFPMFHERVQGGELPSSPESKLVDQIVDLERKISDELVEYDVVMEQIKEAIAYCKNQDEMKVLKKKYLEGKTIPDIALDLNVSESTAYTLHNRAIKQVNVFLDN